MSIPFADIEQRAGNSFDVEFEFYDEDGALLDLTGAKFVLTAAWGDWSLRIASDDVSPDVTIGTGTVRCHQLPGDTADWPIENIPYELERWEGADQYTYVEGRIVMSQRVNDNV